MRTALLIALGLGLIGVVWYRRASWHVEVPMSEQRRKVFGRGA